MLSMAPYLGVRLLNYVKYMHSRFTFGIQHYNASGCFNLEITSGKGTVYYTAGSSLYLKLMFKNIKF